MSGSRRLPGALARSSKVDCQVEDTCVVPENERESFFMPRRLLDNAMF